ncbi:MAG TPA: single-stranded DNA-binding protein, partial [Edaphobacter sp.]|nr:single-stranded DNA-binding protein [Edaphobacter sp.]
MPHSYKNYAHLEGVVDEDAVVVATSKQGEIVAFRLAVRELVRDANGENVLRTDVFDVEIGPRNSRFAATLRKGTPVMIDAQIRTYSLNAMGLEHRTVKLKAHRIHSIDYNGWKKGVG